MLSAGVNVAPTDAQWALIGGVEPIVSSVAMARKRGGPEAAPLSFFG